MRKIRIEKKSEILVSLDFQWWGKNALTKDKKLKYDEFLSQNFSRGYIEKSPKFFFREKTSETPRVWECVKV
jgi:hypothetical protein